MTPWCESKGYGISGELAAPVCPSSCYDSKDGPIKQEAKFSTGTEDGCTDLVCTPPAAAKVVPQSSNFSMQGRKK